MDSGQGSRVQRQRNQVPGTLSKSCIKLPGQAIHLDPTFYCLYIFVHTVAFTRNALPSHLQISMWPIWNATFSIEFFLDLSCFFCAHYKVTSSLLGTECDRYLLAYIFTMTTSPSSSSFYKTVLVKISRSGSRGNLIFCLRYSWDHCIYKGRFCFCV